MWYAVYETQTGRLESLGTVLSGALPAGLSVQEVGESMPEGQWDSAALTFVPVITSRVWTTYEFLKRFTSDERKAIRAHALVDPDTEDFMDLLYQSGEVRQSNPDVIKGLNYLAYIGKLGSNRPGEILNG